MPKILDGKKVAEEITTTIQKTISALQGRPPGLAFILVGSNPASEAYIRMKKKGCDKTGILSLDHHLKIGTTQEELLALIERLNSDPNVDGILIQLPLPKHIDTDTILSAIDPAKDVDGFHPINVGKILIGASDGFAPCTPLGIVTLLKNSNIETKGKHVVIVGRSNIVGKPLAALLMQKKEGANATVTVAHSATQNLVDICRSADILIAAIGSPHFIKKGMVKQGAVVVDVGINRTADGLVGDVDFDEVAPLASAISPVPGGVGPMTIASLLSNTLLSYQRRLG